MGGRFDYMKQRLGVLPANESVLPQEFDYPTQALLYIPSLPDVRAHCRIGGTGTQSEVNRAGLVSPRPEPSVYETALLTVPCDSHSAKPMST